VLDNLTLDYFDVIMNKTKQCLVRYADDFLILTKTQEEALAAKDEIAQFLAGQGFELHPQKTVVRAFNDGIYFLGYLFVNDLVVNATARMMKDSTLALNDASHDEPVTQLQDDTTDKNALQHFHKNQLQTVCVTGSSSTIFTRQGQICIYAKEKPPQEIPVNHIDLLIVFGKHNVSTPALLKLLEKGAQVHFASAFGKYIGTASANTTNPELHLRQANLFANQPLALTFAKKLIAARIRSQREVLRQRKLDHQQLSDILSLADATSTTESLMGYEAQAAKRYWSEIREHLGSEWLFERREKPNSKDPFNSLLNMGYSLLFAHIDTMARAAGLYPSIGAYHKGQHYSSLAADLIEPFRYIVERKALSMIALKQIKPADFEWHTNGQCLLSAPLRRLWIFSLIDELQTPKYSNGEEHFSLLNAIHQQNISLIAWLEGEERFTTWMPR
jgi:CRISPR-associated endonuclease Cas1